MLLLLLLLTMIDGSSVLLSHKTISPSNDGRDDGITW